MDYILDSEFNLVSFIFYFKSINLLKDVKVELLQCYSRLRRQGRSGHPWRCKRKMLLQEHLYWEIVYDLFFFPETFYCNTNWLVILSHFFCSELKLILFSSFLAPVTLKLLKVSHRIFNICSTWMVQN